METVPDVRLLVNAATITVGGGVQAAVSFIEYAARLGSAGPLFAAIVSEAVHKGLPGEMRSDPRIKVLSVSPAKLVRGMLARKEILELEGTFRPHVVYSIGFPSYVKFQAPEVGRYTNGWEICDFSLATKTLTLGERISRDIRSYYRRYWARYARYFETQTEIARQGIIQKLNVRSDRILVLPNSVNHRFLTAGRCLERNTPNKPARVFCLSAGYRHKNLCIIGKVAEILARRYNITCKFILTLPRKDWSPIASDAERRGVLSYLDNIGPLTLDQCVEQYKLADCLFLPTLAEIFSVTYLEAMAMKVPIITTDLDFAHDVCRDAAVYYDPLSAEAAASAIHSVLTDLSKWKDYIERGERRLRNFPDQETKYRILIDWLVEVAKKEKVRRSSP